jgi:hypothetical protein
MRVTVQPAQWFMAALILTAVGAPCAGQQGNTGQQDNNNTTQRGARPDNNVAARQLANELEASRRIWGIQIDETRRPNAPVEQRLVFAQISEDFLRIQVLNDELAKAATATGPLDFKLVAQTTAEIKKRAGRLKFNLMLPEPDEHAKRAKVEVGAEAEQLRAALVTLVPLIDGFAHNPVFKETKVVDAKMSAQARADLDQIIELSSQLKKNSELLHKTTAAGNKP